MGGRGSPGKKKKKKKTGLRAVAYITSFMGDLKYRGNSVKVAQFRVNFFKIILIILQTKKVRMRFDYS